MYICNHISIVSYASFKYSHNMILLILILSGLATSNKSWVVLDLFTSSYEVPQASKYVYHGTNSEPWVFRGPTWLVFAGCSLHPLFDTCILLWFSETESKDMCLQVVWLFGWAASCQVGLEAATEGLKLIRRHHARPPRLFRTPDTPLPRPATALLPFHWQRRFKSLRREAGC